MPRLKSNQSIFLLFSLSFYSFPSFSVLCFFLFFLLIFLFVISVSFIFLDWQPNLLQRGICSNYYRDIKPVLQLSRAAQTLLNFPRNIQIYGLTYHHSIYGKFPFSIDEISFILRGFLKININSIFPSNPHIMYLNIYIWTFILSPGILNFRQSHIFVLELRLKWIHCVQNVISKIFHQKGVAFSNKFFFLYPSRKYERSIRHHHIKKRKLQSKNHSAYFVLYSMKI